jgi:hypothetical protein
MIQPIRRSDAVVLGLLLALITTPAVAAPDTKPSMTETTTPALPAFSAADPSASPVTEANLMASERFWPYMVSLVSEWRAGDDGRTLPSGSRGVLKRVDSPERVRVDFGRDGLIEVPVDRTDLIAGANAIRTGEARKDAPNLTWAIGARILDGGAEKVALYGLENALAKRGFLMIFVDPADAPTYAAMASALAAMNDRHGVLTVVVPQGKESDEAMLALQKRSGWSAAFMLGHLAIPYTTSLLPDTATAPYVMLQTSEGRVIAEGPWSDDLVPRLAAALETAFGPNGAAVAAQ